MPADTKRPMTDRQRAMAVLHYEPCDRLPIVHFGFWHGHTLQKWAAEGHLSKQEADAWDDGNPTDAAISARLGFDFNWYSTFSPFVRLDPAFEQKVVKELPDGTRHLMNCDGVVVMDRPGAGSIPSEIDHTLKNRTSWEEHYKWRYQWSPDRVNKALVRIGDRMVRFDQGGLEFLRTDERTFPYALFCGSLYGQIRDVLGMEGSCYLQMDDPDLFDEIIQTVGDLSYRTVKYVLASGARFDYGHFWEDICFKNGPLITPSVFAQKVGPHYKRITDR